MRYSRKHGGVNYCITQVLSGHGYFRKYLYNIGKTESAACIYSDEPLDDANQTFFKCHRWKGAQRALENKLGQLNAENLVEKLITGEENWQQIAYWNMWNIYYALKNGTRTHIFRRRRIPTNSFMLATKS